MKYYKYQDNYGPLGEAITYVEVENGVTLRQITLSDQDCHGSNVKSLPWGLILADQQVDYDSIEEVTPISKDKFDGVWKHHLANREPAWVEAKNRLPVGTSVSGYIEIFYPQGVIIDLGADALGVADYEASRESTDQEFMYPGHKITAIVTGYDEENQWIVLGSPRVHDEQR
jgi:hypothetical protein